MRIIDAIAEADTLRPNAIEDELKARWLMTIEVEYAEVMGGEMPSLDDLEAELLMPAPHDYSYVYYLCALIDNYNQDTGLYANDMEMANAAVDAAKAWWIRNNRTKKESNWRTMPEFKGGGFDPLDLNKE